MHNNSKRGLVFTAVVVLACLSFIPVASASGVSGSFSESSCSGGGVTVTLTTIVWTPATLGGTAGCFDTGINSSFTYSGGTVGAGVAGNILDLTYNQGVVPDFITFPGTTLNFVLDGFVIPTPTNGTNCAGTGIGQTCVAFPNSPFLLTNNAGQTGVSLSAYGLITDGGVTTSWTGIFTTQLTQSPGSVESTINGGGSIASAQSGQFTMAPEPATMSLLGAGLIAIAIAARKRRKA